ncbi:nucleoside diphosphate kinase 7 [Caerostris extrusa]|uniref:Nucleoside diphosphate kinase 7 n=1 Tax=Caerostris extrusa TaxID=172846 RepID=A0AAV4NZS3_CAEEX|nr:nucleoside diphosphate kinase 7 [Caerostris extrusa]
MSDERYRFLVEWFDPTMKIKRKFMLSYFSSDGSVEMYDLLLKKLFLRRIQCDSVREEDLFVGSIINVLSRQLYIIDFGDRTTASKFTREVESTIFIINESGFTYLGRIISILEDNNLLINRGKIIDKEKSGFNASSLSESLKKLFLILEVRGQSARSIARKLVNPESPVERPLKADLRDLSGHCLAPTDDRTAETEIKIFFPSSKEVHCNTAVYRNSTCCIIKPHAVREKIVGKIIQDIIVAGFKMSAFEVVTFNLATASEFLDVYKGVVAEYKDMVSQLMSGPSIALEITKQNPSNVFEEFRTYVGPADPEIARKIRPGTLRANYGHDKIKNAVHCTDLPEDASLELDYLFRILPA